MESLSSSQIRHLAGFGQPEGADAYVFCPRTEDEIAAIYELARSTRRSISFAGSQRSYGSPMMTPEGIVISLSNFSSIGEIKNGCVEVGGGVTLDQIWRHTLPHGFWPKLVSGTARPTVAGAIAMNIHGKNAFKVGAFEDSVLELDIVSPDLGRQTLKPNTPEFHAVCGGAGLHGAIVRAVIQLHPITSGGVSVVAQSPRNWEQQIACFEEFEFTADYMVSWVDLFGGGRGLFHAANYASEGPGLNPVNQLRTGPILGLLPRAQAWRVFKWFLNPTAARILNAAKDTSARIFSGTRPHTQTVAEFNFLLDSAPRWERAYGDSGLLQFQVFIPKGEAVRVFRQLESLQKQAGIVSTLGVMKRHHPTQMILDYSVEGYSLAMDFRRQPGLEELCRTMTTVVLDAGGKFYLAKDSTLTRDEFARMHSAEARAEFAKWKAHFDPENLIQSIQSRTLGLS